MWHDHAYVERRQLFLRSYRFSRKQSAAERIRRPLARLQRIVRLRLRAVRRAGRVVWAALRRHVTCCAGRRRGFRRLSRWARSGGDRPESSAARDWFGTPCHLAWAAGRKGW